MPDDIDFQPNWVAAPTESIRRALIRRGWSSLELAEAMQVPTNIAQSLVDGTMPIDSRYAAKLASALQTSTEFWIKRQRQYSASVNQVRTTSSEKAWLRELPLRDMAKFGWISSSSTDAHALSSALAFFGVSNVAEWQAKFRADLAATAFRTSQMFTPNPVATIAWLRWAELQAADMKCKPWNVDAFKTVLTEIRGLTRRKHPDKFIMELQRLCAECGVAVVIARAPEGCRASGATRFISSTKALIVMSFRYRSDDHFWFTFFHEAGHLVLHNNEALFLEDGSDVTAEEEKEANTFASDSLIPPSAAEEFANLQASAKDIMRFAVRAGISAGIVVGQLQHSGRIPVNRLNRLKRRYVWATSPKVGTILEMR